MIHQRSFRLQSPPFTFSKHGSVESVLRDGGEVHGLFGQHSAAARQTQTKEEKNSFVIIDRDRDRAQSIPKNAISPLELLQRKLQFTSKQLLGPVGSLRQLEIATTAASIVASSPWQTK